MAEETSIGSGIFHFVKKSLAQIRSILKLVSGATVVDNFVSFTDVTGGQKDSGKKATDFCASDDARLSDARTPSSNYNGYVNYDASSSFMNDTNAAEALGRAPHDGDTIRVTAGTPTIYMRIAGTWSIIG